MRFLVISHTPTKCHLRWSGVAIRVRLRAALGGSGMHFEDSRFNISLVTATSTRIQSEDVLHGAQPHVIHEM